MSNQTTFETAFESAVAKAIVDLAQSAAKGVYNRAKSYIKDLTRKTEVEIRSAFTEYLQEARAKHSTMKTLLYRHQAKPIRSFYECASLERSDGTIIDSSAILNTNDLRSKLLITGTGGIGKSVLLKYLFINSLSNNDYIPVLINLRDLGEGVDLVDFIYSEMQSLRLGLEKEYYRFALESGIFLIMLDGFDEVKHSLVEDISKEILTMSTQYRSNIYIISSRPMDIFSNWNQFEELRALPLTKSQAINLIKKIDYDHEVKARFLKALSNRLFDEYKSFASNPLLLTIMLLTFENRASIPDKLNDFYEQAFITMFQAHDATKGAYKREIKSGLGYENFKFIFSYLCFKSFFESQHSFNYSQIIQLISQTANKNIIDISFQAEDYLDDLTQAVCMLVKDGLEYRFVHRSFQEYFAAFYSTQLNDNIQSKFFKSWLISLAPFPPSSFLEMLYEMQPQRFIKNILFECVEPFYRRYLQADNKTEWLITNLYSSVSLRNYHSFANDSVDNDDSYDLFITFSPNQECTYIYSLIQFCCSVGGYRSTESKEDRETFSEYVKDYLNHFGCYDSVDFSELKAVGLYSDTLHLLSNIESRLEFSHNFISNSMRDISAEVSRFEDILSEL